MVRVFGVVDYPKEGETVGSIIGIQGWALSDNHANDLTIEVFVDDVLMEKSSRNDIRLDVANDYPTFRNSDRAGFYIEVKLDKFKDKIHDLKVIARTSTNSEIICKRKFSLMKKELLPPQRLREYVGGRDFKPIGQEFLNYFTNLCYLNKNEHVLDIGCGSGRMALPLTNYLTDEGHYEGLDVVPEAIEWDKQYITSQFPNFNFTLANVYNNYYIKQQKQRHQNTNFLIQMKVLILYFLPLFLLICAQKKLRIICQKYHVFYGKMVSA